MRIGSVGIKDVANILTKLAGESSGGSKALEIIVNVIIPIDEDVPNSP